MHLRPVLFGMVCTLIYWRRTPEKVALMLQRQYPEERTYDEGIDGVGQTTCCQLRHRGVLLWTAMFVANRRQRSHDWRAAQVAPKGTELSVYSKEHMDAIGDEINNRPCSGLEVRFAFAEYRELVLSPSR